MTLILSNPWKPELLADTWVNPDFQHIVDKLLVPLRGVKETISPSGNLSYSRCAHRHWYEKEEGLRSPHSGHAAEAGSLAHHFLALAYREAWTGTALSFQGGLPPLVRAEFAVSEAATKWVTEYDEAARLKGAGLGIRVGETMEIARLAVAITYRTLRKYLLHDLASFDLIGVELPIAAKLAGMMGVASHVVLDVLFREKSSGSFVVMDNKTTTKNPGDLAEEYQYDPQRPAYVWAVAQAFPKEHVLFVYNALRKKSPGEPDLNQCPKCKGVGCAVCAGSGVGAFSLSPCDTTPQAYFDLKARYPHLDLTRVQHRVDELTRRGDTFNGRIAVPTSPTQIDNWLAETADVVRDRRASRRTKRWRKNRSQCSTVYGLCPFRELCEEDTPEARRVFRPKEALPAAMAVAEEKTEFSAPF